MTTLAQEFEAFWQCYPRRQAKLAAMKAYARARKLASAEEILAGVERYRVWMPAERQFRPLPTTFLNQGRWMDEDEGAGPVSLVEQRAGAFCQWYEAAHERVFQLGYIGTRNDYEAALRLVAKFSDEDLQHATQVWFGMEDDFATRGTRTIPKFTSRASHCVELARGVMAGRRMA